jgi:hypothetical protein
MFTLHCQAASAKLASRGKTWSEKRSPPGNVYLAEIRRRASRECDASLIRQGLALRFGQKRHDREAEHVDDRDDDRRLAEAAELND